MINDVTHMALANEIARLDEEIADRDLEIERKAMRILELQARIEALENRPRLVCDHDEVTEYVRGAA
jgi:phage host-nuclease inhibitor protein Gam